MRMLTHTHIAMIQMALLVCALGRWVGCVTMAQFGGSLDKKQKGRDHFQDTTTIFSQKYFSKKN
jgi:hypothetical protein